ncbi:MAG: minor capsid protein [Leucobacter sp.]
MDDDELTRRLCGILAGLPGWEGPDRASHAGAKVAVFYGAIDTTPDVAVGVRVYGEASIPGESREVRRVQFRFRGEPNAPNGADRLAGIVHAIFSNLTRVAGVNGAIRASFAPMGADKNRREERADNYLIIIDNLEAYPS